MNETGSSAGGSGRGGPRNVTVFFSDMVGFSDLTRRLGDVEASRVANRILALQEIIITRDGAGQVLQFGGDSVFAVFDSPSAALNRALEIQRVFDVSSGTSETTGRPGLRIGLHMGEVLFREEGRIEVIGRHVNRAHRVMEAATAGQILASEVVVEAARDFIDIPREQLAIQYFGEFHLKGVGATGLCEVADLRLRRPTAPQVSESRDSESVQLVRLELAGYRPAGRLGEGAHGVVYRAEQNATGRMVALKVLSPALCSDPQVREQFRREAEKVRHLSQAGVVQVVEERLDHQPPFFAMTLGEGAPADAALERASPERIARVFGRLCEILDRVHEAGVVHCDLKPGNVLVAADDSVLVLDFGISVLQLKAGSPLRSAASLPGTPSYMAPELLRGEAPTPRSDVYSLGVLLFKVLTGREPFQGESIHDVVQSQLHEDPPLPGMIRPGLPDGLQRVCLKALEKCPTDRYASARRMAEDLDRFIRGELVRTRPSVYNNLVINRVRRHVEEIDGWSRDGLVSREEADGLMAVYEGLQRQGIPAVMESRRYHFWQTLVYLGGWTVVNGALFWVFMPDLWDQLSTIGRLLLGSLPALTAFAMALAMWRLERFRLTFVALFVGVLGVPLLTGVWLKEYRIATAVMPEQERYEVLAKNADDQRILTNRQITWAAFAAFLAAGLVMTATATRTHSAQAVIALFAFYSACQFLLGMRVELEGERWAGIAVDYLPLMALCGWLSVRLLAEPRRQHQALPWVYAAGVLLIGITDVVSLFALKQWWPGLQKEYRDPASLLQLSVAGIVQVASGLLGRAHLGHRCRFAMLLLIFSGLVTILLGLGLVGQEWPDGWPKATLFGKEVPTPHLVMPLVAMVITLLACRFQLLSFLFVGLIGFAASVHLLGGVYFEKTASWPRLLVVLGAVVFFVSLYRELRRTRGSTIDDLVSERRL